MEEIDPNDITSGKVWETGNDVSMDPHPSPLSSTNSPKSATSNTILTYIPSDASNVPSFAAPADRTSALAVMPPPTAVVTPVHTSSTPPPPISTVIESFGGPVETQSNLDPYLVARATLTSFDLQLLPTPYQAQISEPSKHGDGLKDAYVSYLICTKDMEQGTEYKVRRRFTDFVWLHQQLTAENPEYITGDRFSTEFLEKRRSSLSRFLNRIIRHPVLQKSPDLNIFLTSSDWVHIESKFQPQNLEKMRTPKKDGMFENLSEAILNTFSKLKNPDIKFLEMKEQVNRLEDHLQTLEKCYTKMIKKHLELEHEFAELGMGLTSLGVLEAGIIGEMTKVGSQLYEFARNFHERAQHEEVHLCAQLRDYLHYCSTVKVALRVRDHKQLDYEVLVDACQQAVQEKQKLETKETPPYTFSGFLKGKYDEITGVDQERARADRLMRLESKITQLEKDIADAHAHYTHFSQSVAKEIDYFQATRSIDFKEIFLEYTEHQIQFFQNGLKQWEAVLPILDQIQVEEENL